MTTDNRSRPPKFRESHSLSSSFVCTATRAALPLFIIAMWLVPTAVVWSQGAQGVRETVKKVQGKVAKENEADKQKNAKAAEKETPKARARKKEESAKPAAGDNPDEAGDAPTKDADAANPEGEVSESGPDRAALPAESDMQVPTVQQLLHEPPVDWIVLKDDFKVVVTDPIHPRPDTVAKIEAKVEETFKGKPLGEEDVAAERDRMLLIPVSLKSKTGESEYGIHIKWIDHIVYHEDLLLRRTKMLMEEALKEPSNSEGQSEKMAVAYELLTSLMRRVPDWPGAAEVQRQMLFYEALYRLNKGETEAALAYLEDLHASKGDFPDLSAKLGEAADKLIDQGFQANDYRRARYYLVRLRKSEPQHPVAVRWTKTLAEKAREVEQLAIAASEAGKHAEAAELIKRAASIWSDIEGMKEVHQRLTTRYQTLNVGVLNLPDDPNPCFLPTDADYRNVDLTEPALFEVAGLRDTALFRSSYFEQWEPTDLGRRVVFSLRQSRQYWESQPVVTAQSVVSMLAMRLDPRNSQYDPRFASYVKTLKVRSPFELEIEFTRVPISVEALLLASPPPNHHAGAAQADISSEGEESLGDTLPGRFQVASRDAEKIVYRRTVPEPENAPEFHIAEIAELKQKSAGQAVQNLLRSELDVLPHLPAWDIPRFLKDGRFFVQKYELPVSHVLQVNPRSEALANRELRRAMAYAIDRKELLQNVVLRDAAMTHGRLITGPYRTSSAAYDQLIQVRDNNFSLAFALAKSVQSQMEKKGKPLKKLRMLCVPDPVAQVAAEEIAQVWRDVGIDIELVPAGTPTITAESADWDVVYRTVRVVEPAIQMWSFLTLQPYARVEDVQFLPDAVRLALVNLENSNDWVNANAIMRKLQKHLWEDNQFIPLWELDDYIVLRKSGVRGFLEKPVSTYQDAERWTVNAYFPTE